MRIGIIGSGNIGGTLARLLAQAGHQVAVSNSRGPETLQELVAELGEGVHATTPKEAARFGEVVVVSIPFGRYRELPVEAFAGKVVIDTNNYYPGRDGNFEELDADRSTGTELLAGFLPGARVVKAFNAINRKSLDELGRPAGEEGRVAIPIAGDDSDAKRVVAELIDQIGFDPVDMGGLAQGGRKFQVGSSLYGKLHTAEELTAQGTG